jgi:hypothetical protein
MKSNKNMRKLSIGQNYLSQKWHDYFYMLNQREKKTKDTTSFNKVIFWK